MNTPVKLYERNFKAMGSPCQIQFYAESVQQAKSVQQQVLSRIEQLEQRYSRYRADSLISEINDNAGSGHRTRLDPETLALLHYAEQCYQESEQLFDVTSGVLRQLWSVDKQALPSKQAIKRLLPLVGWQQVEWNDESIYLPRTGMALDFGGIVKEYAADMAANIYRMQGIESGIVELGGDIRVIGPLPDGSGWPVSIRNPNNPTQHAARLTLKQGAVASSGDYERFQLIDGVRYSHILNPKTGWPVTGLRAVSVVAEQCVVAGSLATIAMLKAEAGLQWLQAVQTPFLCCQQDGQRVNYLSIQGECYE